MSKAGGSRTAYRGVDVTKKKRAQIYERDGWTCRHCGKDLKGAPAFEITLDHLRPRSDGGDNSFENLVTACRACNCSKKEKIGASKKDNAGLAEKLSLRKAALTHLSGRELIVLETHAGYGLIGERLYSKAAVGVAFEQREEKAAALVEQRPAWRVYESDSAAALRAGAAAEVPFNFVDVDPYGDPWPTIAALFGGPRELGAVLVLAVNDGLPQKLAMGGGWKVASLTEAVQHFGNHGLYARYLQVARWLLEKKAAGAGYGVDRFEGRLGGHARQMAHYLAVLTPRGDRGGEPQTACSAMATAAQTRPNEQP